MYNPLCHNTPIYGKDEHNQWLYSQGEKLFKQKEYTKAKEYFYDVMINDPQNVNSIIYYGCCLNNLGYYDSSIDALHTALKINPNNEWGKKTLKIVEDNIRQQEQWQEQQQYQNNAAAWIDGLTEFLNVLGNTFTQYAEFTNNMNASRSSGGSYVNNSSSRSNSSSQSGSDNMSRNRDARTYSDLESQLIKMHTYPNTYNDNQRRSIQSQMRSIRTKWESRGFRMFHSQWEDWDG
jgi:tetratricopeptide (TPR) repeat protein